jgi:hypothetical protein
MKKLLHTPLSSLTTERSVLLCTKNIFKISKTYSSQTFVQRTAAILLVLLLILSLSGAEAQAQNNVGIGTTTPNGKAILELKANDKGFLAPRMNTAFMNAIAPIGSDNGLLIYNTDSACYHFYNGIAWKNLCQKAGLDSAAINKLIKNYLNSNATTIINILKGDTALFNYTTTNHAVINILTVDTSITNVAIINNAAINILKVDTSTTNVAIIDQAIINNATIDSSTTNYAFVKELKGGWANMDSLQIGGKNIMQTMSDSIAAQAWLLKGNITTNAYKLGSLNAKDLHIVANNNERITIANATGYVGINQTVPSQHLDVAGNLKFDLALMPAGLAGTNGDLLVSKGAGLAPQWQSGSTLGGTLNNISWNLLGNNATNPNTNFIGTTDNNSLRFRTNNTQKMIIDSMGNVGIGSNTPMSKLQVSRPGGTGLIKAIADGGYSDITAFTYDSNPIIHPVFMGNRAYGSLASPLYPPAGVILSAFVGRDAIDIGIGGARVDIATAEQYSPTAKGADLLFKTTPIGTIGDLERMRILENGNVGIGTTTPSARLEVNSGTAAVSGLKLTQLSGLNSTSTSNYPTVLYSGAQMEPSNFGFVYDRTNTVFYTTAVAGATVKRSTGAFAFTALTTTLQFYGGTSCAALDAAGNVYLRNNDDAGTSVNNKIMKITPGNVIIYIANSIQSGTALAVAASGDIYFNGNYYDPRLWKTTPGGVVTLFNADLSNYSDLQFDNSGILYACGGGIIYKFTAGGVRSVFASNVSGVQSIKFDGTGQLYAGSNNGTIYKISALGVPTVYVAGVGNVSQMDFDASGNLLFVDINSGILYTISNVTLASTTVLSIDNAGNVIPGSSNGISNSSNVYNSVPGSLTVNGSLYVENDKSQLPYSGEHIVNITNTAIDLGTQMIPYLAKYKTIRFMLPANAVFTWNVPVTVAAFQQVVIQGTGNSNLSNITSQINMTVNRVFSYVGTPYKNVYRAEVLDFGRLAFYGVFINHTHNDFNPTGAGGRPVLFDIRGITPTITFDATIVNSADHIVGGDYLVNGSVLASYVNFTKNPGAPADIQFIYTAGIPWNFPNTQRFIIFRYPGTGTTLGAGVLLDMGSGKIIQM